MHEMIYFYRQSGTLSTGEPVELNQRADCRVYEFSEPDAFGAMALCWFSQDQAENLKYLENDVSCGTTLSSVHVANWPVGENGTWQSIHVRQLVPKS